MHGEQFPDHEESRAQRFDVQLPLRYRARGETAWREGRTENFSYTGVLFWADELMDVHTPIELTLATPSMIGGTGTQITCRGEIVRTVLPASAGAQPGLAVKILKYRLARGRARREA